jgi:hypothetical protein
MDKEKQIEEMAKFFMSLETYDHEECEDCGKWEHNCCDESCFANKVAIDLYNAGYRKYSENTIELPCKVGDTVYRVKKRRGVWYILPREVVSLTYRLDHLHNVVWEIFSTETDVLGKSVFLTMTDAEQFLAKMKIGGISSKQKEGEWIICSDGYYPYCSECKNEPKNGVMTEYCPHCGAKMKGGAE